MKKVTIVISELKEETAQAVEEEVNLLLKENENWSAVDIAIEVAFKNNLNVVVDKNKITFS